jgi:hypothetical protein
MMNYQIRADRIVIEFEKGRAPDSSKTPVLYIIPEKYFFSPTLWQ